MTLHNDTVDTEPGEHCCYCACLCEPGETVYRNPYTKAQYCTRFCAHRDEESHGLNRAKPHEMATEAEYASQEEAHEACS